MPYKKAAVSPDSIGRALQVGTLVRGHGGPVGQPAAGQRLADQRGDRARRSADKALERPREEIFALQDDLAKEVSMFLRQQLGQEITLQEARQGTTSAKAWELLQRAEQATKDVDPLLASGDTAPPGGSCSQADSILALGRALDPAWSAPASDARLAGVPPDRSGGRVRQALLRQVAGRRDSSTPSARWRIKPNDRGRARASRHAPLLALPDQPGAGSATTRPSCWPTPSRTSARPWQAIRRRRWPGPGSATC